MKKIIAVFMCVVLVINVCGCDTNKVVEEETAEGPLVYIAPTGSRFHLRRTCAGVRSKPVLYGKIKRYYGPCKKCTR